MRPPPNSSRRPWSRTLGNGLAVRIVDELPHATLPPPDPEPDQVDAQSRHHVISAALLDDGANVAREFVNAVGFPGATLFASAAEKTIVTLGTRQPGRRCR